MSRYKLEEVDYRITGYSPRFKIIDNEIEIEDREREDGSIAYLHDVDEDMANLIAEALEKQIPKIIDIYDYGKAHCPSCKTDIHGRGRLNYCCYCGKKLEWY